MSDTFEEHKKHVKIVLDKLNEINMKLQLKKCHFGFSSIEALGHVISGDGRRPDPKKIEKWQDWVRPETGKQVMALLGFVNYLRDYVPLMFAVTVYWKSSASLFC